MSKLEELRDEASVTGPQPLVNEPHTIDAVACVRPYPLMSTERQRAPIRSLVWYLARLMWWRFGRWRRGY